MGRGIVDRRDYTFYYGGDTKDKMFGTGFLVTGVMRQHIIDFNVVDKRISTLRCRGKFFNITIINCHAPTEEKSDEEKESFYDLLSRTYDKCPKHDIKIVIGDMNAQIGKEEIYRPVIGKHSLHDTSNDNGTKLIDFSASKNLVIGSTRFQHKRIHKATWIHPNGSTRNQIDHVLVDGRHIGNLQDVRSFRGANIDSDHFLVGSSLKYRISNYRKSKPVRTADRINVEETKNPEKVELFKERVRADLTECDNLDTNCCVNAKWEQLKSAITNRAVEVFGTKKSHPSSDWFDRDCEVITDQKNAARKKMLEGHQTRAAAASYQHLRREEKKLHRRKKRELENQILSEAQNQSVKPNKKDLFAALGTLSKPFQHNPSICRDRNGDLVTDQAKCLERWAEHFKDLLGSTVDDVIYNRELFHVPGEEHPPTIDEFELALNSLKNNKSPGSDSIPNEILKLCGSEAMELLFDTVKMAWEKEELPNDWYVSVICPIFKKGDPANCSNYRGISLLNSAYKVFSNILYKRLLPYAEENVGEYQSGFRTGRSTIDQIFVLRQILEKTVEYNVDTFHIFVDFKAAYDSVLRSGLYSALNSLGVPAKLIHLVRAVMKSTKCHVKVRGKTSNPFEPVHGLRQGDALSGLLFNMILECAIRKSKMQTTGTIFTKTTQIVAYADDIAIVSRNLPAAKEAFIAIEKESATMGLSVNYNKTKAMAVSSRNETRRRVGQNLTIGNDNVEVVKNFNYLGSTITDGDDTSAEIGRRILLANRASYSNKKALQSSITSRKTKLLIYKTLIRSVLCYGAEAWRLSRTDENRLAVFERRILRRIFGGVCENGVWRRRMNHELYHLYADTPVVGFIKARRLAWAGHVARMSVESTTWKVFTANPDGTRKPGRPRLRWGDGVDNDTRELGVHNWRDVAVNREEWRRVIMEAKTRPGL